MSEAALEGLRELGRAAGSVAAGGKAPAIRKEYDHYLIISDLQIPYHDPLALDFCRRVKHDYAIPQENVICVGDEVDQYWASRYDKSPNAPHTAEQELDESAKELARWATVFPFMRICDSNHGGRWAKAAERAGIPARFLRKYQDLLGVPSTWVWANHWIIKAKKQPFRVEHGHVRPGGHAGLRLRPLNRGISTAWGHEHAEAGTIHLDTHGGQMWGMRVGSLISKAPVPAFSYNHDDAMRPCGSVGVVLDGGRTPLIVRM